MKREPDEHDQYGIRCLLRRCWQDLAGMIGVITLPLVCGCSPARYVTPQRLELGYTIVLPGIEGTSFLNANIASGLVDGGWPGAVEVYDWTAGTFLFPLNLRDLDRNRRQAAHIAEMIRGYQDRYPGCPVHLIGHSGGGGVAVLTLEALPREHPIRSAILLGSAISPDYDLRAALSRTEYGIWNFYSQYDYAFLEAGTFVLGTIDGQHTSAAGRVGFRKPAGLDAEVRRLYATKLHQEQYCLEMADCGHAGGHMGWACPGFGANWLCPILQAQMKPSGRPSSPVNESPRGADGPGGARRKSAPGRAP